MHPDFGRAIPLTPVMEIMEDTMENEQNSLLQKEMGITVITTIVDDMWRGLKKFWWILLVIISLCTSAMYWRGVKSYTPVYEAYSTFVVNTKTAYGYNATYYNKVTAEQLSKTFPYILTSGVLKQVVANRLGLDSVPASIRAESMSDTALFTIRVRTSQAQMAYDVLQAVIESYPIVAEYIIGDTQLTLMDESGVPQKPVNLPDYRSGVKKGFVIGMVISIGLLVLYALSRNTVRQEKDLQNKSSLMHLGSIPTIQAKKRSQNRACILMDEEKNKTVLGENLRSIRMHILSAIEKNHGKKILVTSAAEGEGKTTLSVNLAISLARKGYKVILVDGDLRNPSVADAMGLESKEGYEFHSLLSGKTLDQNCYQPYKKYSLSVVTGGKAEKKPNGLLIESKVKELLNQMAEQCDYLIIDTPPCDVVSDATIYARCVDAAVMVVRQDYTRIERILRAIETMSDTQVQMLGYVLNGTEAGITGYGYYGYGYGYGYGHYGHYGHYGRYGYGYGRKKYGYGYGYGDKNTDVFDDGLPEEEENETD
ncbi:MAG: polysaccharide biosynthesis tyrosine autokinase [Lachnospiraceae bacterium]